MALIPIRRPWAQQPPAAAVPAGQFSAGLNYAINGSAVFVGATRFVGTLYALDVSVAPSGSSPSSGGLGYNFSVSTNGSVALSGNDLPLAAASPWTFAASIVPYGYVSLSHIVGFGEIRDPGTWKISGSYLQTGKYRGLLNFNSNYYFWGNSADWDTGIAFDTDGRLHTVLFYHDGTNIYFYRDGVLRASTARPVTIVASDAGTDFVIGSAHNNGTVAPNAVIVSAAAWSRGFSAVEAAAYTANPWQLFAPRRIWVPVGDAAAADNLMSQICL